MRSKHRFHWIVFSSTNTAWGSKGSLWGLYKKPKMDVDWLKEKAQAMQAASSVWLLVSCMCKLITQDYLWWVAVCLRSGGSRQKADMQHSPGTTQTHSVTTAERRPCDGVFVHRARLGGKTSIVIFALGLLVLKEQILLLEGGLQSCWKHWPSPWSG